MCSQLTRCILYHNFKAVASTDDVIAIVPLNLNVKAFISLCLSIVIQYLNIHISYALRGGEYQWGPTRLSPEVMIFLCKVCLPLEDTKIDFSLVGEGAF